MKKISLLILVFISTTFVSVAQDGKTTTKKNVEESIYTSLKPADGQGAVFNSKEEMQAKIQDKKDKMIGLIKENANDPVKVKQYREELWRFENAVVKELK